MKDIERKQYRLHARLPVFKKRIAKSKQIIKEAIQNHPGKWLISTSGGKDSSVMVHLCQLVAHNFELFHMHYNGDDMSLLNIVENQSLEYRMSLHIMERKSELDVLDDVGFFIHPRTQAQYDAMKLHKGQFKSNINAFQENLGGIGVMIGLRAQESNARRFVKIKKGYVYSRQDTEIMTCCPLLDWSGDDIWAYIVSHDIVYLDKYDNSENRIRERSEVVFFWTESIWRNGFAGKLKQQNPELYFELLAKYPEISRWV